jgi:hypothetical protein
MAELDPQEVPVHSLGPSLDAATEELRAALEREAADILRKAGERAARIENDALHRAEGMEREAQARSQEILEREIDRWHRAIAKVDILEQRMQEMFAEVRECLTGVVGTAEQDGSQADVVEESQSANGPEPEALVGAVEGSQFDPEPATVLPQPVPFSLATAEAEAASGRSPELDALVHAQIVSMRDAGRTRGEAQRFLLRFRSGSSYTGLLDDIYPEDTEASAPDSGAPKRRRFKRPRV